MEVIMDKEQYFLWDDDVPIRFSVNREGQWVVDGANLCSMARSAIWRTTNITDFQTEPALKPADAIDTTLTLFSAYREGIDEAVLPDWVRESVPICDKDGNELEVGSALCECGHLFTYHQTGVGAWTGFCYASRGDDLCECEIPKEVTR